MAEPSEEIPRKKSRRRVPSEFEIGRFLGQFKRRRPSLVTELNEYAKATGRKPTQVMEEALEHYIFRRRIIQSEMTVEQLYEAFMLVGEFQAQAVRLFLDWAKLMFSEEYQSMLELRAEMAPPPPKPRKLEDLEERIMEKAWNILEPVLDWTMESFMKAMAPMMGVKPPIKGLKVPVSVTYEEEEQKVPIPLTAPNKKKRKRKPVEAKT